MSAGGKAARALWTVAAVVLATGGTAAAQTASAPAKHPIELSAGGLLFGQTSFGTRDAEFLGSDGRPLTIFRAESALRPGFGVEAHLGFGLTNSVWAEASGTWARADFRTRVSDDIENVAATVLKEPMSRFSVEGSVLWLFAQHGKTAWFARGGAGWMRELTGQNSLLEDGLVGSIGGGVKYLWKDPARTRFRPVGFRIEGRVSWRARGLSIGPDRLRLTPGAAGSVIFGS